MRGGGREGGGDGGAPRAYRWLLRLLPPELRARHGRELETAFAEALERARAERGRRGAAATWAWAVWDVVRRSLYERVRGHGVGGGPGLGSTVGPDLRFAFRSFVRQPGITLLAVLMLSLGVASSTAVFTLAEAAFLRPLPFPEPERLVDLNETAPKWNLETTSINYPDFHQWRESAEAFEAMALYDGAVFNLFDGESAERIEGALVTHDLSSVLRVDPVVGRMFTPEDDRPGAEPVVMLGYDLWRTRFGGDPGVVGRVLRIDGRPRTVVGVLPPEAELRNGVDLWAPMSLDPLESGGSYAYSGIGRLKPGVSVAAAQADLERAHAPIWEERDTARVVSPVVKPYRERLVGDFRPVVVVLGGAVGLVLLIACGNVAAILLARSFARRRELGVRVALGAGRGRLTRQLLTESLALSLVAGPLGLVLGFALVRVLTRMMPGGVPVWMTLEPGWWTALFGLGVIVATALLFGLAPVLQVRRQDVRASLADGGSRGGASRGQRRTMNGLVVAEVTLAALLLVAGGLLLRALDRLNDVEPGFRTEGVLAFRVSLPEATYPDSAARYGFYRDLLERVEGMPGVEAAGAITCPPLGCHWGNFFRVEGAPPPGPNDRDPVVLYRFATPRWFEAMGIRLVSGRFFDERTSEPAIVVNETFAAQFFPGEEPLGRRIRFSGSTDTPPFTIIGVTRDVRHYGLDEPMRPGLYFPLEPVPPRSADIAVWTAGEPTSLTPSIRGAVRELDPELPLSDVRTTGEDVRDSLAIRRAYSWIVAVFAGLALVLAVGGIYGVLSYAVGQRSREVAVRVALGATRPGVVRLVLRHGLALVGTGLALGFAAAAVGGRLITGLLVGLPAWDPATFGIVAAVLTTAALAATLLPARRALRVEPQAALREE